MLWWRKVRNHIHWLPGAALHPEGPSYYVHDVTCRPTEEGLSLYSVADETEANILAHYFALTLTGYDHLDYLLIPDSVWEDLGIRPGAFPYCDIHLFLSDRHQEVRGLTVALTTQLADLIWRNTGRQAYRLKKAAVKQAAPDYLESDSTLRPLLHEEWESKLFPK